MTRSEAIRKLRTKQKELGLNQKEFAKKFGLNEQYFGAVLNGKKPPSAKVLKLIGLERVVKKVETFRPVEDDHSILLGSRSTHGNA